MRFRLALSSALFLLTLTVPAFAQYDHPREWGRPRPPKTGACFYRDAGFRGDYFCLNRGENWPSMPPGFNDRISSIRIFRGAQVRIFNDSDFRGVNSRIDRDVPDLRLYHLPTDPSRTWNDRISSISVYREHDEWDRGHPDGPPGQYR